MFIFKGYGLTLTIIPVWALSIWACFKYYDTIKKIWGDLCGLLGGCGKYFRKSSVKNKIEGSLNLFTKFINKDYKDLILPGVKVEVADEDNIKALLDNKTPIIRMKFSRDNTENLVKATVSYVNFALLREVKPYLRPNISQAIDLSVIRQALLKNNEKEGIRYFDDSYLKPALDAKEGLRTLYLQVNEIDEAGYLGTVLLKEYKDFGQAIFPNLTTEVHVQESEKFFKFMHSLSVRRKDEKSQLKFAEKHIKLGIILVSKRETFQEFGMTAYLQRIKYLTLNGIETFYFFARGDWQSELLEDIRKALHVNKNYHEILFKKNYSKDIPVVVALFKLDYEGLLNETKESLQQAKDKGEQVEALITRVNSAGVEVDVGGMTVKIPVNQLSKSTMPKPELYFHNEDELRLRVLDCQDVSNIILSNVGTETDPIDRIEKKYSSDASISAHIESIIDSGLVMRLDDGMKGFVSYGNASYSRSRDLKAQYSIGQNIQVSSVGFDPRYKSLKMVIKNRPEPWQLVATKYTVGDIVDVRVCGIQERRLYCELEVGVEGVIFKNNLDWMEGVIDNLKFEIDQVVKVKIIKIDLENQSIFLSRKEALPNPVEQFYEKHKNAEVVGKVSNVNRGAFNLVFEDNISGVVLISEADWNYVPDLRRLTPPGSEVRVRLLHLDSSRSMIWASRKRTLPNPLVMFQEHFKIGEFVTGNVSKVENWGAIIKLDGKPAEFECVIPKGELTNLFFVTKVGDLLALDGRYGFVIKDLDATRRRVVLSRKLFFEKKFPNHQFFKYGQPYSMKVVGQNRQGQFILEYENSIQAILVSSSAEGTNKAQSNVSIGDTLPVSLSRMDEARRLIEVF